MEPHRTAPLRARATAGPTPAASAGGAMRTHGQVVADAYNYIVESYPTQFTARSARSARSVRRAA
ncbi:hypothetical protein ACFYUL_12620 [Streptomyces sp. NPDC004311]|uniref:hypothetical protein n=1 Tax=Streptomyces sp. NPDC004311 TaxID=3364698 RepID=UPI003692A682